MLSRRAFVGKLAAGTAGAAVALTAGVGRASTAPARKGANTSTGSRLDEEPRAAVSNVPTAEAQEPVAAAEPVGPGTKVIDAGPPAVADTPPPWELFRPLKMGSLVAHGWRVAGLSGIVHGSCVLTLRNARGRTQRVHLCRNDGRPQGLVYTKRFDMVVMNGGLGDLPTEEGLALAVGKVAHLVAANEGRWQEARLATDLLPHRERLRLFSDPEDRRLR
jgi:hypothetical protein